MLNRLFIKNLILIEKAEIHFSKGFNIITGETGAGKSVFLSALSLLLGSRADNKLIATGAEYALVEASFEISNKEALKNFLKENGLRQEESGEELVIRRIVRKNKQNQIYIDGQQVHLSDLKAISSYLLEISSQHEYFLLSKAKRQLSILDRFSENEQILEIFGKHFKAYKNLELKLEALKDKLAEFKKKEDFLLFQLEEIKSAEIKSISEFEEISSAIKENDSIKDKLETLSDLQEIVDANDGLAGNMRMVNRITNGLDNDKLSEISDKISELLSEFSFELSKLLHEPELDQAELENLKLRLDKLNRLLYKFGPGLEDVLEKEKEMLAEIENSDKYELEIKALEQKEEEIKKELIHLDNQIFKSRETAASQLSERLKTELNLLAMEKAELKIQLNRGELKNTGSSVPDFLFRSNPSFNFAKLGEIASGGELSRLLLAIRLCLGKKTSSMTMLFDEIDQGIGGMTAKKIASSIKKLSSNHQILCVSHLAQMAAVADSHFIVVKEEQPNGVKTNIKELQESEKDAELARMMGLEKEETSSIHQLRDKLGSEGRVS